MVWIKLGKVTSKAEHATKAIAIGLCHVVGIDPIDSLDSSPNWWMFNETATKIVADLQARGFLKEESQPKEDQP